MVAPEAAFQLYSYLDDLGREELFNIEEVLAIESSDHPHSGGVFEVSGQEGGKGGEVDHLWACGGHGSWILF